MRNDRSLKDVILNADNHDMPRAPMDAEAFRKAMEENMPPALLGRFNKIIAFEPFSGTELAQIAGHILAREMGDKDMTTEQKAALGDIALQIARQEGYDPDKGARGIAKALERGLSKPLPPAVEDALCANSAVYAVRRNGRRADALAEGFKAGVDARPMKALRLRHKNGFAAFTTGSFNF